HWTNSETPFTPPRGPVDGHEQITARVRRENCPPDSFLIRLISEAFGQHRPGLVARLDLRPHLGRCRCLLVKEGLKNLPISA
ncbi:hypothetical protein, partial [Rhodovulum sp.]|uniref:hypothetical protein n=1 Tax=Rhodovulum sp. TaxID=34009 RepID=UPI00257EAB41